jgi:hypothetical protein
MNATEIEDILELFSSFDEILKKLAFPRDPQTCHLIPAMIGHDAKKKWFNIVTTYDRNQSQEDLIGEDNILLLIKERMSKIKNQEY